MLEAIKIYKDRTDIIEKEEERKGNSIEEKREKLMKIVYRTMIKEEGRGSR